MAHVHEKIDFTASVYVVYDNKVLLHKHKKLHIWLPPGGHIELDEDPNQTAIREVKEEAGLEVELVGNPDAGLSSDIDQKDLIPPKFLNRHYFDATRKHEHIDSVYFGRANSSEVKHEIEGGEIRWFTKDEVERNDVGMLKVIQIYALKALEELRT